jgi:hypothetical protein
MPAKPFVFGTFYHPAFTFLVGAEASSAGGETSTTPGIDTTGATLIVISLSYLIDAPASGGTPTISDSKGNTWTPLTEYATSGHAFDGEIKLLYTFPSSVGAAHTFSANLASSFNAITVAVFGGKSATFDQETGATSPGATTQQPGSITPSANNALLVSGCLFVDAGETGDASINSGFTLVHSKSDASGFGSAIAYKIQTSAGAENPTWTSPSASDRMGATLATFT